MGGAGGSLSSIRVICIGQCPPIEWVGKEEGSVLDLENVNDLRLIVRVKNNRLVRFRESKGLSQKAMAEMCGISQTEYGGIENLITYPVAYGGWSESAKKIVSVIGVPEEVLFPEALTHIEKTRIEREVPLDHALPNASEVLKIGSGYDKLELEEAKKIVLEVIERLPGEKVKKVLFLRFYEGLPLRVVAEKMGYEGGEFIRQLESKGLRMLRHPQRSKKIGPALRRIIEANNDQRS